MTTRRPTAFQGEVVCAKCRQRMRSIGYKIPVPRKQDEKAWNLLRVRLRRMRHEREQAVVESIVRRRHELEQLIKRLESLPANQGREKTIRQLRKKLFFMQDSPPPGE